MNNSNLPIDKVVEEIIVEFEFFEDWEDKYAHIIDMGRKLESMEDSLKDEKTKLKGCQSTVYFTSKKDNYGVINFKAYSEAAIVQGLIALLLRVYNKRTSSEILSMPTEFIVKIGLNEHLSVTRKNGLSSMVSAIKKAAKA